MKSLPPFLKQHRGHRAVNGLRDASATCTIRLTVDTGSITTLRRLAARVCGAALEFIRVVDYDGGARMQVWLCVHPALAASLRAAILTQLPGAQLQVQEAR